MKKVTIYTDGACSGNPGPGGYSAILIDQESGTEKTVSGGCAETTNNRMELSGAIEALSAVKFPCAITVYTDSKYLSDAINLGWAKKWKAAGWMRNKKDKALNPDLWEKLLLLCEKHNVSFVWVKGHAGNDYNNRCDELAVEQSRLYSKK